MRLYLINAQGEPALAVRSHDNRFILLETPVGTPCRKLSDIFLYNKNERERMLRLSYDTAAGFRSFLSDDVSIYSPIEGSREDIICLAENYKSSPEASMPESVNTVYFSKRFSHAVGDGGIIPAHGGLVQKLDYEAELLVILGEEVCNASEEEALQAVFGYSVINDVSARDLQARHKQWYRGKSLDGFTAVGPCIVTADEIDDVHDLEICTTVNGVIRQHSSTACMIKRVGAVIAELSQGMTLRAGTMIATGTPPGCGKDQSPPRFLKSGDTVCCCIGNIGTLTNIIG